MIIFKLVSNSYDTADITSSMLGRQVRGDRVQRKVKRANRLYLKNVPDVDADHTRLV